MNMALPPTPDELQSLLLDARERTLALTLDLNQQQLFGPRLDIVNPVLWELGHLAWFQEYWCLRQDASPSIMPNADQLYNSATVPHETRWDLPVPDRAATLQYMRDVLERVAEKLERRENTEALSYFAQLAIFHEDMHGEAFAYTRQTLAYSRPQIFIASVEPLSTMALTGDANIAGGAFFKGAAPDSGFIFDNEKWGHEVFVEPFQIARVAVTNKEFSEFVDAGGYQQQRFWSQAGWEWRTHAVANAPVYWIKQTQGWMQREYDQLVPLKPHTPVMHVNWHEAQAYCNWAERRLPTEAEWEMAAAEDTQKKRHFPWGGHVATSRHANLDGWLGGCIDVSALPHGDSAHGCRQMLGNVWEWTADTFHPYPGFIIDPYQEYSQPWFGSHKVLRGGCFATRARLLRNTWRNFYTPDRRDIYAGFRTCAKTR